MLKETNDMLAVIKNSAKLREIKRAKRRYIWLKVRKWTLYVALTAFTFAAIFYPVQTGEIIGVWLHDFFGTIYKNISNN